MDTHQYHTILNETRVSYICFWVLMYIAIPIWLVYPLLWLV